jgi:hypothetical protein
MAAATRDRDTQQQQGVRRSWPVGANALIYAGVIASLNASNVLVNGATSTTQKCVGVTRKRYDNTGGADGAITAETERGVFGPFANSASTDQITLADIGNDCFIVDNQTVARTNGSNSRSVAGKVFRVEPAGIWIDFR